MRTDLTPLEVEHWLRSQAKRFEDMANTIHTTFSMGSPVAERPRRFSEIGNKTVTAEQVIDLLGGQSQRKPTIAERLGVSEDALDGVLTEENGFNRNERGWYSYDPSSNGSRELRSIDLDSA